MIDLVSWPARFRVESNKINLYLLNPASDDGGPKCAYLTSYGFSLSNPRALEQALIQHACRENFIGCIVASYGLKFLFDGPMPAANGLDATLLSVWMVRAFEDGTANFVTTRPSRR